MTRRPPRGIDHTGQRFGRLTVVQYVGPDRHGRAMWKCKCRCGAETVTAGVNLRTGDTTSCGCRQRELNPGLTVDSHGRTTRLYNIWAGMRDRCRNPKNGDFRHYGGRGIAICAAWDKYAEFRRWALANGYRQNLTIDRIDNDGDYEPANCRWATRRIQAQNRRFRTITYQGTSRTVREWADFAQLPYHTFRRRLSEGWSMKRAINQPLEKHNTADKQLRGELHREEVAA